MNLFYRYICILTECEFPYWGDGCLNECKCSGRGATGCNPVRGCLCKDGWHGDKCDADINECDILVDPCQDVKKECINEPGSYSCRCKDGYSENDGQCQGKLILLSYDHLTTGLSFEKGSCFSSLKSYYSTFFFLLVMHVRNHC
jgi:hypothetical protein